MTTKTLFKTNYNDEYLVQIRPVIELTDDNFISKSTHFYKYKKWCKSRGEKPLSRKEFDAYNRAWISINHPDFYCEDLEKVGGIRVPVWYQIYDDHADEVWYDENGNIVKEIGRPIDQDVLRCLYQ